MRPRTPTCSFIVAFLLLALASLSASAPDTCSSPLSDLQADIEALRAQLAAARETAAELQSSLAAASAAFASQSSASVR